MADEADTTTTSTETTATATPGADEAAQAAAAPAAEEQVAAGDDDTLLGGGSDPKDGSDGDEASTEAAAKPEIPEAYELAAPEGMTLDPKAVELATPVFKELGLSNEQANKLVPVAAQWAQSIRDQGQQQILAEVATQRAQWATDAKADQEIGGAGFDASLGLAAKALDQLGFPKGSPLRSLLNDSGLGNHPEMIRAFARVGKAISEDTDFVRGDKAAPVKKTDAEIFYPEMVKAQS